MTTLVNDQLRGVALEAIWEALGGSPDLLGSLNPFSPDLRVAGYARVGSLLVPTNTTPGDLTFIRGFATGRLDITTTTPSRLASQSTGPWRSDLLARHGAADNVLTDIVAVTVPNFGLSAFILIDYIIRTTSDRSSESGQVRVDIARRSGAATVVAIADALAGVEQQSGPFAETLAVTWSVDAVAGAVGATQTFNIEVTVDSSSGGTALVQFYARLLSGEYSAGDAGAEVTIAVAP